MEMGLLLRESRIALGTKHWEGIIWKPSLMTTENSAVAWTDVRFQDCAKDGVKVDYFGELMAWPGAYQKGSGADSLWEVTIVACMQRRVKCQRVEPDAVASSTKPVILF